MLNAFASPKQLISHARDEINETEGMVGAFIASQQYARVIYVDSNTGEQIHRVRVTGPALPPKVTNIVKDAAGNLRDALDHAAYSAAIVINGGEPRDTGFPFAKDAAGVEGELASKRLRGNPSEIRPILAGFNPHEGGNETLWTMNQIRNPSTHRFIVPVGSAAMSTGIGISSGTINSGSFGYSFWDATANEVEYLRIGAGSHLNYQVHVTLQVTFEGVNAVTGKLLIPTLRLMATETERVVTEIEAAAQRIGRVI
jgi:hypothetical protein